MKSEDQRFSQTGQMVQEAERTSDGRYILLPGRT